MNKRMPAGCFLRFFTMGFFILVAAGVSLSGWDGLQKGQASRAWPTAEGVIIRSEFLRFGRGWKMRPTYLAGLQYEYEVGGQPYVGNRVFLEPVSALRRNQIQEVLDRYPLGAAVTVYYDPADPSSAVLEPGAGESVRRMVIMAVVLICLYIAVVPLIFQAFRRSTARSQAVGSATPIPKYKQ